jgi:hypothetical protein
MDDLFSTLGLRQAHITAKHKTVKVRGEEFRVPHRATRPLSQDSDDGRPDCGCEEAMEKYLQDVLDGKDA